MVVSSKPEVVLYVRALKLAKRITYAEKYDHKDLLKHLREQETLSEDTSNAKIHTNCQRLVNNRNRKRNITNTDCSAKGLSEEKMLRSSVEPFDWKSNCLFRGKKCQRDGTHPDHCDFHEVTTLGFKDEILLACQKREGTIGKPSILTSLRI